MIVRSNGEFDLSAEMLIVLVGVKIMKFLQNVVTKFVFQLQMTQSIETEA